MRTSLFSLALLLTIAGHACAANCNDCNYTTDEDGSGPGWFEHHCAIWQTLGPGGWIRPCNSHWSGAPGCCGGYDYRHNFNYPWGVGQNPAFGTIQPGTEIYSSDKVIVDGARVAHKDGAPMPAATNVMSTAKSTASARSSVDPLPPSPDAQQAGRSTANRR